MSLTIKPADVVQRVELYFEGGVTEYLSKDERRMARQASLGCQKNQQRNKPLDFFVFREASERQVRMTPKYPGGYEQRGIVICGGGPRYFPCLWVCVQMLRQFGCKLPIQVWHLGSREMDERMKSLLAPFGVETVDAEAVRQEHPVRRLGGWELKSYAIMRCPFREVMLLDADNVPVCNPDYLFETKEYRKTGAVFWPDLGRFSKSNPIWDICGVEYRSEPEFESGQILVDKKRCWKALSLALWYNEHSDFYYRYIHGDKDTFHLAFRKVEKTYAMPSRPAQMLENLVFCQHDFDGEWVFQHRNRSKWSLWRQNRRIPDFWHDDECLLHLEQLRSIWDGRISPDQKVEL